MGPACVHPTPEDVGRLLSRLLGKRVIAKRGGAARAAVAVSGYIVADGGLAAVCVFDLDFANYAGAALAMVPNAVANEAIRIRTLEPEALENLQEVANIMASLFNNAACHTKLRELTRIPPALDISALCARPVRRLDLDVDITGYGMGHISLFFAAPPAPPA